MDGGVGAIQPIDFKLLATIRAVSLLAGWALLPLPVIQPTPTHTRQIAGSSPGKLPPGHQAYSLTAFYDEGHFFVNTP
jgi:hypothetical protein